MHIRRLVVAGLAALGLSSVATAADLIVTPPPEMLYDSTPVGNWDGFSVGVFAGFGRGFADMVLPNGDGGPCDTAGIPAGEFGCDNLLSGWLLGATAAYHMTMGGGPLVLGVAGDVAIANITGTDTFPFPVDESTNTVNWEGSIRGVLGFDAGTFMPYVTGGLAVAHATHNSDFSDPFTDSVSATHLGGTVGAGVQIAVTENLALDLQLRTSVYGPKDYDHGAPVDPPTFAIYTHRATAGVNFMF